MIADSTSGGFLQQRNKTGCPSLVHSKHDEVRRAGTSKHDRGRAGTSSKHDRAVVPARRSVRAGTSEPPSSTTAVDKVTARH